MIIRTTLNTLIAIREKSYKNSIQEKSIMESIIIFRDYINLWMIVSSYFLVMPLIEKTVRSFFFWKKIMLEISCWSTWRDRYGLMYVNLKESWVRICCGNCRIQRECELTLSKCGDPGCLFSELLYLRVHLDSCWRMFYHNNILNFSLGSVFRELLEVLS
jgi:hypothetical protein